MRFTKNICIFITSSLFSLKKICNFFKILICLKKGNGFQHEKIFFDMSIKPNLGFVKNSLNSPSLLKVSQIEKNCQFKF